MALISFQDGNNFIRNAATVIFGSGRCGEVGKLRTLATPGDLPISLEALLIDLSIDDADAYGDTVDRLARAAAAFLALRTARCVIQTDYELRLDNWWAGQLEVRRAPLRDLTAIEYLTAKDTWVAVPTDQYWVVERESSFEVMLLDDFDWPDLWQIHDCIRLQFTAGYDSDTDSGSGSGDFPLDDGLRAVFVMLTAHYFEHRELFAADKVADIELAAGSLLGSYRTYW